MENVTVRKQELLDILRENRTNHRAIFEEACEGYQKETERILQEHLDEVRAGKRKKITVSLPYPEDHTKDYDRAIKMVEMSVNDEITMTDYDFQSYVMDDWQWKRQFLASNAPYSSTATEFLESM